mgnify:CR=1 FL=1
MRLILFACDDPAVQPRSLPGTDAALCNDLAQVCPLGEPECTEMHLACPESPCKACVLALDISDELGKVCALHNAPLLCACEGPVMP